MSEEPLPKLPDPSLPRLPGRRQSGRPSDEQANAATFGALIGLGLLAFSFIGMVALVLPQIRGLVLVLFGAIGFFFAHYVLWGWWLPKMTKLEDDVE